MNRLLRMPGLMAAVALLGACAVAPVAPDRWGSAYPGTAPATGYGAYEPVPGFYDPAYVYPGYPGAAIGVVVPPPVVVPPATVIVRPAPVIVVPGGPRHGSRRDEARPPFRPWAHEPRPPARPGPRREPAEAFVPRDERGEAMPPPPGAPRFRAPDNAAQPAQSGQAARDGRQGDSRGARPGPAARAPAGDPAARAAPSAARRADPSASAREQRSRPGEREGSGGDRAGRTEVDRP